MDMRNVHAVWYATTAWPSAAATTTTSTVLAAARTASPSLPSPSTPLALSIKMRQKLSDYYVFINYKEHQLQRSIDWKYKTIYLIKLYPFRSWRTHRIKCNCHWNITSTTTAAIITKMITITTVITVSTLISVKMMLKGWCFIIAQHLWWTRHFVAIRYAFNANQSMSH